MSEDDVDETEADPETPRPQGYPGVTDTEWQSVPDDLAQTISLGPAGDGENGQDWVLTYTPEKRDEDRQARPGRAVFAANTGIALKRTVRYIGGQSRPPQLSGLLLRSSPP